MIDQRIVKSIGASGQISLGKEHAGRKVLVETPEPGVWIIRTATIIPIMKDGCMNLVLKRA